MAGFGKVEKKIVEITSEPNPTDLCGCKSGRVYSECCMPLHQDPQAPIDSATKLVRARFSAYVYSKISFLLLSTHPESKDYEKDEEAIGSKRSKRTIWQKQLEARATDTEFANLQFVDETESDIVDDNGLASVSITLDRRPKSSLKFDKIAERITVKKSSSGGFLYLGASSEIVELKNPQQKVVKKKQMN